MNFRGLFFEGSYDQGLCYLGIYIGVPHFCKVWGLRLRGTLVGCRVKMAGERRNRRGGFRM